MTTPAPAATALRIASWITAINVLIAAGYAIAGIVSPKSILPIGFEPTAASSIFAMYAGARAIPLALGTLAVIYKQWVPGLALFGTTAGVIQLLDAAVGLAQDDPPKIIGPFVIFVLQFLALWLLFNPGKGSRSMP